ncbi:small, acid-soluble spore protein Tlp [Ruminiclostridium hungatei]|uniref:Protein Tlp homolog n=1 Tax=Ruminiclostridium hungatei TaxID=48256 RepID=A0A1V4SNV5_RUMHU|nr:small acid-soluble spore protein Tlp [Ruminiclostridium hungatei]OPX44931.1 small, acid-soluble spore protein Tlp [Ruminiclostridium hungatei]
MDRPKPDDRSNNADRIQFNINHTIRNMEAAEELIEKTDDRKMKNELEEKNERRGEALQGMREEIREEALHKKRRQ